MYRRSLRAFSLAFLLSLTLVSWLGATKVLQCNLSPSEPRGLYWRSSTDLDGCSEYTIVTISDPRLPSRILKKLIPPHQPFDLAAHCARKSRPTARTNIRRGFLLISEHPAGFDSCWLGAFTASDLALLSDGCYKPLIPFLQKENQ